MISVKSYNLPNPLHLNDRLDAIKKKGLPAFANYQEDIGSIMKTLKAYKKKNLIVIGNGGSVTSLQAFYNALMPMDRRLFILTSMEPDLIHDLREKYSMKDTLVMAVSKSGTTVGIIESLFMFKDYEGVVVTSAGTPLAKIADKLGFCMINHPDIGGRFSGLTSSALAPALFLGMDVDEIMLGAKLGYAEFGPSVPIGLNPCLSLAVDLFNLEHHGYTEVFCPLYSSRLGGFSELLVQLMHESACKKERGQTFYCSDAPEAQHHTNQRFFGGRRNVAGLFVRVEQTDKELSVGVPRNLQKIKLKDSDLSILEGLPLANSFSFESLGTMKDAVKNRIPVMDLSIGIVSPRSVGEFLAFLQLLAYYSASLRGVDPFDQPQVEASKEISFELRKNFSLTKR